MEHAPIIVVAQMPVIRKKCKNIVTDWEKNLGSPNYRDEFDDLLNMTHYLVHPRQT